MSQIIYCAVFFLLFSSGLAFGQTDTLPDSQQGPSNRDDKLTMDDKSFLQKVLIVDVTDQSTKDLLASFEVTLQNERPVKFVLSYKDRGAVTVVQLSDGYGIELADDKVIVPDKQDGKDLLITMMKFASTLYENSKLKDSSKGSSLEFSSEVQEALDGLYQAYLQGISKPPRDLPLEWFVQKSVKKE
jgi:hypothetical protein